MLKTRKMFAFILFLHTERVIYWFLSKPAKVLSSGVDCASFHPQYEEERLCHQHLHPLGAQAFYCFVGCFAPRDYRVDAG